MMSIPQHTLMGGLPNNIRKLVVDGSLYQRNYQKRLANKSPSLVKRVKRRKSNWVKFREAVVRNFMCMLRTTKGML